MCVVIAALLCYTSQAQMPNWNDDAAPLHRAEKALTDVMVHDVFSPPAASRAYAYANMAAYEVLVHSYPGYVSLYTQLPSFPLIPASSKNISSSLAAVYSFLQVSGQLVFSDAALNDSLHQIIKWYKNKNIDTVIYANSLQYGKSVADSILAWAAKDHYKETRTLRRYTYLKGEGKWSPTPPGYFAAVEPYWYKIRCLTMDSASQFKPKPPVDFSKDSGSLFYNQAFEVYNVVNKLSKEQKAVASFWDCNPFDLNTNGHLFFASKKISPGGHWMNITALACRQTASNIIKTSSAYTLVAIALFDGFISCWDEKYRSNSIRPETFINRYIDEAWRPLLQTPPFPEYTSGHSVVSTAAAAVLTQLFGDGFSYNDNTETEFDLPVRHFNSFREAANEAAISRLYGGIHYRSAVANGQEEGGRIGEWVMQKIHLKKGQNQTLQEGLVLPKK
ncbi:MAG: vanadium-dependent haloperoxidase [Bacteroidota bacterium]|nr:vanadium-dependent haloperoxidase [Bacteroidota bacterium]